MAKGIKLEITIDDKGTAVVKRFAGDTARHLKDMSDKGARHIGTLHTGFTKMGGAAKGLGDRLINLKTIAVGALAGWGLQRLAGSVTGVASTFEDLKLSLDTITKGRGEEWFKKLNEWALKMPVNTEKAIEAFKNMRAMGLQPTIKDMTILVDTVGAVGGGTDALMGIARALGQIQTKGKVSAEELMQLAERGIPAYDILREKLGLTREELGKIGTLGIEGGKAVHALLAGMGERFAGMSARMQKTWAGMVEASKSYWKEFVRLVMEAGVFDFMKRGLGMVLAEIDTLKATGRLDVWAKETAEKVVTAFQFIVKGAGLVGTTFRGWKMIWEGLKGAFAVFSIAVAAGIDKVLGLIKKGYEYLIKYYEVQNKVLGWIPGLKVNTDAYRAAIEALGGAQGFAGEMTEYWDGVLISADKNLENLVGTEMKQERAIDALIRKLQGLKTGMEGAAAAQNKLASSSETAAKHAAAATASLWPENRELAELAGMAVPYTKPVRELEEHIMLHVGEEADKTFGVKVLEAGQAFLGTVKTGAGMAWDAFKSITAGFVDLLRFPEQFVDALQGWIDFAHRLPEILQSTIPALIDQIPAMIDAIVEYVPQIIQRIIDYLPDLVEQISARLPELIEVFVGEIIPAFIGKIPDIIHGFLAYLPAMISSFISQVPVLVSALAEAMPQVALELAKAMPFVAAALAGAVLDMLTGGAFGFGGAGSLFSIFHGGGMIGRDYAPTRPLPAFAFAGAPRAHTGLGPDERPIIAKRDETIFTPGQLEALGRSLSSQGEVRVYVYLDGKQAGRAVSKVVRDRSDPDTVSNFKRGLGI